MDALKKATAGTVSELDLMKRAVQANNFQIPVKDLAKLFEFATKRAQQTGQSVDYLVDSIVLGIGRKSPLILDNLGISAVMLRQKLKGVGVEMTTVGDIAAAVGEIAEEEMLKSGKVIDTNTIKIERLSAQWADFKKGLAEDPVLTETTGKFLDGISRQLRLLPDDLLRFKKAWNFVFSSWIKTPTELFDIDEKPAKESIDTYGELLAIMEAYGYKKKEIITLTEEEKKLAAEKQKEREKRAQDMLNESEQAGINILQTYLDLKKEFNSEDWMENRLTSGADGLQGEFSNSISMFPLADEQTQDLGFDTEAYVEQLEAFEQFKNDFASLVQDFGVEVVEEFGQAIGTMIATGKFPDDFGSQVLSMIGSFIVTLGEMLITMGIASKAFQELLKSAFTNPLSAGLAIAAGAALVLLGSAFQGAAKSGPSGGSSGGGSISGSSYSSSSYGSSGTQPQQNTVEFVIKGNTLVGVLNNQSRKNGLIG